MRVRIWHGLLVAIGLIALPGLIAALWFGVLGLGFGVWMLILATLGILMNAAVVKNADRPSEETDVFSRITFAALLFMVAAFPLLISGLVWSDLTGPYAYQFKRDYSIAHYIDQERRFELDYPADFDLLTPAEARVQLTDRTLSVTPSAVLFIGWGPEWTENINIQMSPATFRDGELIGDDEDELQSAGTELRKLLQDQYPDASVDRFSVEEHNDRYYLHIKLTRDNEAGNRIAQRMSTTVIGDKHVTFTTTTLTKTATGLNRYRFATIIESFRVLDGKS